jgi:hypothetical protein
VEAEGGEQVVVVQELERRRQEAEQEGVLGAIRQAVAEQHEVPLAAVLLLRAGAIPKTSSGKVQRHACHDAFLAGTLDVVASWPQAG